MGDILDSMVRSFFATVGVGLVVLFGLVAGFVYATFRLS